MRVLARLKVVEEDLEALRLLSVVLDDDARAADDLAGVALAVDLSEAGPGAEDLGVRDLDQVDLVLGAESLDELDVLGCERGGDERVSVLRNAGTESRLVTRDGPSVQVSTRTQR